MSTNDLFNQKEFPEWKGYNTTEQKIRFVKELWCNNVDMMARTIHETTLRAGYYHDLLLYIQRKLYLDEPLNICLNSANEIFDIMISPCEVLNDKGKELTLKDYEDIEKL